MNNKEVVGNIRIKESKKNNKTGIGKKIFIWIMFLAMLASFLGPLVYYLISVINNK